MSGINLTTGSNEEEEAKSRSSRRAQTRDFETETGTDLDESLRKYDSM
jgi:hypothetical protein